jgi:hypothetical protein
MLRNKFKIACFVVLQAVVAMVASASTQATSPAPVAATVPSAAAPAPVVNITNCTYENGMLGDTNGPIRDFCLSQTTDISSGKSHIAMPFAMGYYVAMKCTAANSVLDGSCKNAANTIANGVAHAFHLDYTTLHKIRSAVPAGSTGGCPCSAS